MNRPILGDLHNQIENLIRNQGQQRVLNSNGQNITYQQVSGGNGTTQIHIATILNDQLADAENIDESAQIEGLPEDDGNEDWEDLPESNQA